MRILVFGHSSHTGFGVVTERLGERFLRAGHDVRVIAVNHRGEPVEGPLAGRVWPASLKGDSHGGNISAAAIAGTLWTEYGLPAWKPDVVLVIADMSGLAGHVGPRGLVGAWTEVPVFHYCPIEGDNLPVNWRGVWAAFQPVAMSAYGAQVIGEHIGSAVPMIYHGVDTETFHAPAFDHPLRWQGRVLPTREACREAFGLDPRRKYVLRMDRLVERKFYHTFLEAMVRVMAADHDVSTIIHCRPQDPPLDLTAEIARIVPTDMQPRVILTKAHDTFRGLPTDGLVALLNCADLYVSTTGGEGFGLTLAEALACEVPVVCTGWAAEREVVGPGGVLVEPLHDSRGEVVRFHSQYGMDWAVPDAEAFVAPVLELLRKPSRRRSLGRAGREHVIRNFSWDTAAAGFLALFEESNARSDRDAA